MCLSIGHWDLSRPGTFQLPWARGERFFTPVPARDKSGRVLANPLDQKRVSVSQTPWRCRVVEATVLRVQCRGNQGAQVRQVLETPDGSKPSRRSLSFLDLVSW